MSNNMQCIYCQSPGPFSKEHALPRCLGEFEGFPLLTDRVCKGCNHTIGQAEEQFCRSGPDAFFRKLLGIDGRSSHKEVNPFERGSAGAKPIDFVALHPELALPILWEWNLGERSVREVRQIVLIDGQGQSHPLRISTWMREPSQLRQAIAVLGLAEIQRAHFFASDEETPWVESLVQGLGRHFEWLPTQPSSTIANPVATFSVTDAYFRAVAKCGFHYFLAVASRVQGSARPFAAIREFIISGGDRNRFVCQEPGQLIAFPEGMRPARYGHVIVAEWRGGTVEARAQFFLGPDHVPPVYRVRIAEGVVSLHSVGQRGHFFVYFSSGSEGKYHGETLKLGSQSSHT